MDLVIVETAAVAGQRKVPSVDASKIAPWIPPLNRSSVVINSESKKGKEKKPQGIHLLNKYCVTSVGGGSSVYSTTKGDKLLGCPKKLASLIRAGDYDPSKAQSMTTADVKSVCEAADVPFQANSSKV